MLYRLYIQKLYATVNLPIYIYMYIPKPSPKNETTASTELSTRKSALSAPTTLATNHAFTASTPTSHALSATTENATCTIANNIVLSEAYEPHGISAQYQQQALDFAKKLHLNIGNKIYMRSTQDLAAILLPNHSLVIIGPIHANKDNTKNKESHPKNASLNANTNKNENLASSKAPFPLIDGTTTANKALDITNNINDFPATEKSYRQMLNSMQCRMVNLWLDMVCQIVMHDIIPPLPEPQAYAEADRLIPLNLKNITKEVQLKAPHNQYRYELAILDAVAEGDLDKVNRAFLVPKQGKFGVLGPTELRSMQNHVHNLNSLVSRTAIHSGILPEKAYALSDKFFMAAEACTTIEQCIELRTVCARSFATLIKEYQQQHIQSLPNLVRNAQLIVSRSLYENCTIASLAQKLQVSPDHLERIFKKNMGINLSTYLYQEKIKEAQELLLNTTESIKDISQILGFKAASHFTRCFKHFTGMSPREYRNCQSRLNKG